MMEKARSALKISLIIPVYNTKQYLRRCLESAVSQTYKNMEIICIDDGSTDGSETILDEYAQKDDRIIAVHQSNMGESGTRNTGLKIATGDYIGFLDCDDWIEPDMYEKLMEALEDHNADMAAAGWFQETETDSIPMRNKKTVQRGVFGRDRLLGYIYERDAYQAFAYMWDKLYKRKLFYDENGKLILFREDLKLGGDVLYLGQLALNTERAVWLDQCFYHYLQRGDSGCHSVEVPKRMDWIRAYQILIELFEGKGVPEGILIYVKRFLAYHCSNVAEIAYAQKDRENCMKCQDIMRTYTQEYISTNREYPERIKRFTEILNLGRGEVPHCIDCDTFNFG